MCSLEKYHFKITIITIMNMPEGNVLQKTSAQYDIHGRIS